MTISRRSFLKAGVAAGIAAVHLGRGAVAQLGPGAAELAEARGVSGKKGTNLLFIMSDQHRGDTMRCEGHPVARTPMLDRLAGEGVRFSRTYCQSPLCVPSRACSMTGRYVHLNRCYTNATRLPESEYTWAEFLRERGYTAVSVGKTHGIDDGLDVTVTSRGESYPKGASAYNNKRNGLVYGTSPAAAEDFYDARIANAAVEQLRRFKKEGNPWALFVGIFSPHPPMWPPKPYDTMYNPDDIELPPFKLEDLDSRPEWQRRTYQSRFSAYTDEDKRNIISHYYGLVTYIDVQIGRVIDELDGLGMGENTVVVYTSDHGDNMGEHGLFAKFASMYEGEVRVPGIIRLPGLIPKGLVANNPIEAIDLTTTSLHLMGFEPPEQMQGRDLRPLVRGDQSGARPFVYSAIARGAERGMMLRTEEWKLCHYTDQAGELYDLKNDPGELVNLYGDAGAKKIRDELTYEVLSHLARSQEGPQLRAWAQNKPASSRKAGAGGTR